VPEKGRLLLVGFGSSAHIVIQIAVHRGHEIWVVTRSESHIRQARQLGAAWAGCNFYDLPGKAEGAVLLAPSGKLVLPTLEALDRGGICSIAGIHLSDVPSLDYSKASVSPSPPVRRWAFLVDYGDDSKPKKSPASEIDRSLPRCLLLCLSGWSSPAPGMFGRWVDGRPLIPY